MGLSRSSGSFEAVRPGREAHTFATSFMELHRAQGDERRYGFRQALTALSRGTTQEGPGPLEGIHPDTLVPTVRAALEWGMFDDLDWLDPSAATRSLYTLAGALPLGIEQRELRRRTLTRLLSGNASTFADTATLMASAGGKGLTSGPMQARMRLLFELPLSLGVRDGPLALTLATRRQLVGEWVSDKSKASLPSRRLASRVIERAAREASKRAMAGDSSYLVFFRDPGALTTSFEQLLDDREGLVWRHVAVARGLVAAHDTELIDGLERALSLDLTPTEWRRAATSIAALASVHPAGAEPLVERLFREELFARDPGVAVAFVWGLSFATESEPEAAEALFARVADGVATDIAEAVVSLRREVGFSPIIERFQKRALDWLSKQTGSQTDEATVMLRAELTRDLEGGASDDETLPARLERGLSAFVEIGAKAAHGIGREAFETATSSVAALSAFAATGDAIGAMARRATLTVLRDIDRGLLERDVLCDLLRLDTNGAVVKAYEENVFALRERVVHWILERETTDAPEDVLDRASTARVTVRLGRLRALLHLVDCEAQEGVDEQTRLAERERLQTVTRTLCGRLAARPPRLLRRALVATVARALDGLIRSQTGDVVDALLVVASTTSDPREYDTLCEASMDLDLRQILAAYAGFVRAESDAPQRPIDSDYPPAAAGMGLDVRVRALGDLAFAALTSGSVRSSALRYVLLRLQTALGTIARASSLKALEGPRGDFEALNLLEASAFSLGQMTLGAKARIFGPDHVAMMRLSPSRTLSTAVMRVLSGAEDEIDNETQKVALSAITMSLPRAIGVFLEDAVRHIGSMPKEGDAAPVDTNPLETLPAWVPARRTLGAFFVQRPLSSGAAGSVFVVCRNEDRRELHAEQFALKVPDYTASAARHLSEAEFIQLFREEASALVSLPAHENLAHFVTFDLAARPRPILVMELVEGPSLERVLETGVLETKKAFRLLDEVLSGLETMHSSGVGHLDIKPANVVLRRGDTAVLVDFGLSGRNVRPGCATGPYGAPEVWIPAEGDARPQPMPADVYAFACLAFEVLTGELLFDAQNEVAVIANHLAHDGLPPKVLAMSKTPKLAPLAELMFSALRRDPAMRVETRLLRSELSRVAQIYEEAPWPLTIL